MEATTTTTLTPALELIFFSLADADTLIGGSSSDVSLWNAFFQLPDNGNPFTSVTTEFNTVKLSGGSSINIAPNLFANSTVLSSVNDYANSVKIIRSGAFFNADILTEINLPAVISIDNQAFQDCQYLNAVIMPSVASISNQCFMNCINLGYTDIKSVTSIGDYAFYGCTSLGNINIPVCTSIGSSTGNNNVFTGINSRNITITIPSSLMIINNGNPDGDIVELQAHNYVGVIQIYPALELTFDELSNADLLIVGSSSDISVWNAFFDLPNYGTPFTSVAVDGNIVKLSGSSDITLRNNIFYSNTSILSVDDKSNCITTAGGDCFNSCTAVTSFSLPALTTAGYSCFQSCTAATSFSLPALTTAGDGCFNGCTATSFSLPALTTAGYNCFYNCVATSFSLPALTTAGDFCFNSCTAATSFDLSSCTNLGSTVTDNEIFAGISGNTISLTIPSALMTINGGSPDGDIIYLQSNNTVTLNLILLMALQKKIQPKIFFNRDPSVNDNMIAGFSIGQIWRNTSANKEFLHRTDGEWIPLSFIVNNSFNGIHVITQVDFDALVTIGESTVYIIKNT